MGGSPVAGCNPVWLAQSRLRRRRFDDCIELCTQVLEERPLDQAAWYLKARALTLKNWVDDTEIEEQVGAHVRTRWGACNALALALHACMDGACSLARTGALAATLALRAEMNTS